MSTSYASSTTPDLRVFLSTVSSTLRIPLLLPALDAFNLIIIAPSLVVSSSTPTLSAILLGPSPPRNQSQATKAIELHRKMWQEEVQIVERMFVALHLGHPKLVTPNSCNYTSLRSSGWAPVTCSQQTDFFEKRISNTTEQHWIDQPSRFYRKKQPMKKGLSSVLRSRMESPRRQLDLKVSSERYSC